MSATGSGGAGSSRPGADAGRGRPLVAGGRRAAGVPAAGGRRPRRGVRGGGEGRAAAAAGGPFVLATWATAKIGPDIHAQVEKVLYSVPWRHIGKTADVRITGTMVQFFIGGDLVKTHPRKVRGKQTDFGDYPPEKIAFHMRTPAWCRRQAAGHRPGLRAGHRRAAGRERALPAPLGAGRDRAGRQARPGPARGRLRQGGHRRATRPTGRSRASWPPGPSATSFPLLPGTAARRRSCAAPRRSRTSSPCPGRSPATPSAPGTRRR